MTIGDFATHDSANPVWADAVRARFAPLNLQGGILDRLGRHHEVTVLECNTELRADRATACAERAVREHVVAVLGMTTIDTGSMWARLEAARIPVIGTRINSSDDATSPVSFPLSSGLPGLYTGLPQLLARAGAHTIGVVVSDYGAATDALLAMIDQGMALTQATAGPVVRVPLDTSSLAGAVASVTPAAVDGVIGFVSGARRGALLSELTRLGFAGSYATQAAFGATALASDPSDTEGALLVGEFAPVSADTRGMRLFRTDMDESPDGAALERTEGAVNGWLAAWVFERVVRGIRTVDAPSVLRAMNRLQNFDMGGITPPLTTTAATRMLPRLFNPTVTFNRALNGTTTPLLRGFVDPFDGALVAP
jgi:hypothetical protein